MPRPGLHGLFSTLPGMSLLAPDLPVAEGHLVSQPGPSSASPLPLWLHRPERPSLIPGVCSQRSSFSLRLFPTPGVPAPTPLREWPAQESAYSPGAPVGWSWPWAGREAAGGQRPPFLCLSSCVCSSQKGVWLRSLSPSVCGGRASCRDRHSAEDAAASQGQPPRCLL